MQVSKYYKFYNLLYCVTAMNILVVVIRQSVQINLQLLLCVAETKLKAKWKEKDSLITSHPVMMMVKLI